MMEVGSGESTVLSRTDIRGAGVVVAVGAGGGAEVAAGLEDEDEVALDVDDPAGALILGSRMDSQAVTDESKAIDITATSGG